jgi:hypothetical protein
VRDLERLARQALEEVAGDRLLGRVADRVDEAVEGRPGLAEGGEQGFDLGVLGDVAVVDRVEPNSAANPATRSRKRSPW